MPKKTVHPLNSYIHIHFPQSPQSHFHPRKSSIDIKKWENHAMGSQFGNIWEIRPQKLYLRSNLAFQKQFYKKDLIFDTEVFIWPTRATTFKDSQNTLFIS